MFSIAALDKLCLFFPLTHASGLMTVVPAIEWNEWARI